MDKYTILQSIIIILITGGFSGFLIPFILKKIEYNKEKLNAQATLIDDLTRTLWKWRYLSKKVAYYAGSDEEKYKSAKLDYENKVWDLLTEFRIQTSKARRLLSEEAYNKFEKFYIYIKGDIDIKVRLLIKMQSNSENFENYSVVLSKRFSEEVSVKIDDILKNVSDEFAKY